MALRRRAFVQIARDYNRRIARYSELATPGQISAERLTGMLIKSTRFDDGHAVGLAGPPRNRQSSSETSPPRTFAEGSAPAATPICQDASAMTACSPLPRRNLLQPRRPLRNRAIVAGA